MEEHTVADENTRAQLPENFFDDNPVTDLSVAQFTYFSITMMKLPELNEKIEEIVSGVMGRERREAYEAERQKILEISKAEDVIKYMRKMIELQNREVLVKKALDMQEDAMPLILKRIMTSGQDVFIENATHIFSWADMKYVEQLYEAFPKIRSPFARSELSLVFGIKGKKEYTSLLLEQFELIRREMPEEDYEQGPLLALHLLYNK